MRKNILLLIFMFSFFFIFSHQALAVFYLFSVKVVVNSVGGDGNFSFHSTVFDDYFGQTSNLQNFQIQTVNGGGSYSLHGFPPIYGGSITMSESPLVGWKNTNITCISDDSQINVTSTNGSINFPVSLWSPLTCTFTNVKGGAKNPVLIVPGILGADIIKDGNKLWLDLGRNFTDIGDEFMDPLRFSSNLTPIDTSLTVGDVIRRQTVDVGVGNITIYDYISGLVQELESEGYAEGDTSTSTIFTFPYDWRYGVSGVFSDGKGNEDALKQKIADIRALTGSDKVDIVAHSTGGLLVKKYVMDNPTDNHIGKAVFVGVPNLGAPKAVKTLLQGDNFGILFLSDAEMKKVAENLPVTYDLSPSNEYYNIQGSFYHLSTWDPRTMTTPNVKDLNFNETYDRLKNSFSTNSVAASNAQSLHSQSFDRFDLRNANVDLYNIVGCKSGTVGKVNEYDTKSLLGNFETSFDVSTETSGDGTVPMGSAEYLLADNDHIFYAPKVEHGKMMSADGVREKIVNILAGATLDTGNKVITKADRDSDASKCQLDGHFLWIFSPLSIEVTDQNGNRSGVASDGSIQNDIPGADYEVMGEHKFVFVPTDEGQTYTTNLRGTGNGTFTLKDQTISNGAPTQTVVWGNVPVNTHSTGQLTLTGNQTNSSATLSFDQNGSGQSKTVQPSITTTGDLPDDFTPPQITITSPQSKDYLRSDTIAINATSTDSGTGVLSFVLAFDGRQVKNADTIDLFYGHTTIAPSGYEKLGNHQLTASSTDYVGNTSATSTTFRIIATPESAISDIERVYSLGWFKNKGTETSLIKQFKAIVILNKRIDTIQEKVNGKTVSKKVEKIDKVIDKVLGKLILTELNLYKSGKILNDQAYQILSEDVGWLLNN